MPSAAPSLLPVARSWAVAGQVLAPQKPVVEVAGLELFAAAPAEAGYARWKAEQAAERAAQRAAELPAAGHALGYNQWKAEAEAARRAFEQRWGIPLGKRVRVQLRGEPREREGLLLAVEEAAPAHSPKLRLRLGTHVFPASQIESVVRV